MMFEYLEKNLKHVQRHQWISHSVLKLTSQEELLLCIALRTRDKDTQWIFHSTQLRWTTGRRHRFASGSPNLWFSGHIHIVSAGPIPSKQSDLTNWPVYIIVARFQRQKTEDHHSPSRQFRVTQNPQKTQQ